MHDPTPPTVRMADESLSKQVWSTREAVRRRWTCPSDHAIASYVDGTLEEKQKCRLEVHLSKCSHCRQVLGDTVKSQREVEPDAPPLTLFNQALLAIPTRDSRAWLLVPAAVVAMIVAIATATIFLRRSEQVVVSPPHSIPAPAIAKSAPSPNPQAPVPDVVRNLTVANPSLRITFPQKGSVFGKEPLRIRWTGISDAHLYEVRVVASDGDLVWKGETRESSLAIPPDVSLTNGSYFVWVTSYLPNGKTVKTAPVSFVVKR